MHTVPSLSLHLLSLSLSFHLLFLLHLFSPPLNRCALIAKLFRRISTVSQKIGNHESFLPLRVSFFSSFLPLAFALERYPLLVPSVLPGGIFLAREQAPM